LFKTIAFSLLLPERFSALFVTAFAFGALFFRPPFIIASFALDPLALLFGLAPFLSLALAFPLFAKHLIALGGKFLIHLVERILSVLMPPLLFPCLAERLGAYTSGARNYRKKIYDLSRFVNKRSALCDCLLATRCCVAG
jgi:hypothetical protein